MLNPEEEIGRANAFHLVQPTPIQASRDQLTISQLLTKKEVLLVFGICLIGALFLRLPDSINLHPTWSEKIDHFAYINGEYPVFGEKLPPPIVADVDGDGVTDMIVQTGQDKLVMLSWQLSRSPIKPHSHTPTKKAELKIPLGLDTAGFPVRIIAMASGHLTNPKPGLEKKYQSIVVLASDWTVYLISETLKLKWTTKLAETPNPDLTISEPSVLVTHHPIQRGDKGCVIVGGREALLDYRVYIERRLKRGRTSNVGIKIDEDHEKFDLDHYSTYAMNGATGELRWKHEKGDFEVQPAYNLDTTFENFKLDDTSTRLHSGELSWQQFVSSFHKVMPHRWSWDEDTFYELAHFKRTKQEKTKTGLASEILEAGTRAHNHFKDFALGTSADTSLEEDEVPNVLVIHSHKGIEVLHFYQGRPLCTLPLSAHHTAHADIDGDGYFEHVHAVLTQEEAQVRRGEGLEELDCYGRALKSSGLVTFKHSICKPMHWLDYFVAVDKYLPGLASARRREVTHAITEPLTPVLIPSSISTRFNLHIVKTSRVSEKIKGKMYDSIFALSSGRVTSIGPHGEFNWQVDTPAHWDTATRVLHGGQDEGDNDAFIVYSFTPSLIPFNYKKDSRPSYVLLTGWDTAVLLSSGTGEIASHVQLPCQPVMPPKMADFDGDGYNDVIFICTQGYYGYTTQKVSGFLHSSLVCVLTGITIVALGIYLRKHSVLPLPEKVD